MTLSDAERSRALESLRQALEAAHAAAIAADAEDIRDYLVDLVSDCGSLIQDEEDAQEPCTDAARRRGCSCRLGSAREYDPEPIVDKWCPLHGRCDPDAARDARMDAAE